MSEHQPDPSAPDDPFDPAASHGSDLDPLINDDQDQPEHTLGTDKAGP